MKLSLTLISLILSATTAAAAPGGATEGLTLHNAATAVDTVGPVKTGITSSIDNDNDNDNNTGADTFDTNKKKKNPCKRKCHSDHDCCHADTCLGNVCIGPQRPPRGRDLVSEAAALADEQDDNDNEEDDDTGDFDVAKKRNPCKRRCRRDNDCCHADSCVAGVCIGPQRPPRV